MIMVRHSLALSLLITLISISTLTSASPLQQSTSRGICATAEPDEEFLSAVQNVATNESSSNSSSTDSEARNAPIQIETWFHVVSSEEHADEVSDDMIDYQFSILQTAYEPAGISYYLAGVTRTVNNAWATDSDDLAMKKALRKGTYKTLNVYFQTDLQAAPGQSGRVDESSPEHTAANHNSNSKTKSESKSNHPRSSTSDSDLTTSILGFCTLPDTSINSTSPVASYIKDGCNVLARTMPGGSLDEYNRGGTAIHEIGHWNGLLHTFQGESCDSSNPGDYIDDTPQQSSPTGGCPARRDSCPDQPGEDLVHDFMDYSSDVCYEMFTKGQIRRMRGMWGSMREGK